MGALLSQLARLCELGKSGSERGLAASMLLAAGICLLVAPIALPFLVCAVLMGMVVETLQLAPTTAMFATVLEMAIVLVVCYSPLWWLQRDRRPALAAAASPKTLLGRHD